MGNMFGSLFGDMGNMGGTLSFAHPPAGWTPEQLNINRFAVAEKAFLLAGMDESEVPS